MSASGAMNSTTTDASTIARPDRWETAASTVSLGVGREGDTLPGMTSLELSRRVARVEDDLTAISDTVLDIKETVDRHTETLAGHGRTLAEHGQTLAEHGQTLAEHGRTLAEHGYELAAIRETQAQHGEALAEILRRLDPR